MASIPTTMGSRSVAQRWLHTLRLALRALRRDWQSGELRVLALALLIAVASVAAVGFLQRPGPTGHGTQGELLGADLVIAALNPIRPELIEAARRQGLQTAALQNFRSVVLAGDAMQLAEVKAAGPAIRCVGRC